MARKATFTGTAFGGFADTKRSFFRSLARHQDRAWFQAHREAYETGWHAPMASLLDELHGRLQPSYKNDLLAAPRIFRIYRDVRFSADKAPFKTQIAGMLELEHSGTDERMQRATALYLHVGLEVMAAAGRYVMQGPVLERFRRDLDDPKRSRKVTGLLAPLTRGGFSVSAFDALKTAPRGYAKDHPHADLLRLKGLVVRFPEVPVDLLTSRKLIGHLLAHARKAAKLVQYLSDLH